MQRLEFCNIRRVVVDVVVIVVAVVGRWCWHLAMFVLRDFSADL